MLYGNNSGDGSSSGPNSSPNGSDAGGGVEYSGLPSELTPDAYNFIAQGYSYGYDTINASGATGTVVIVGGPDGNTITGGSGINWIAGNGGGDIITASGTQNYIFGDSSFIVGEEQSVTFDSQTYYVLNLTDPIVTIDNNGTSAGSNVITVTGSGQSVVFGDYATMQIDGQALGIARSVRGLRRCLRSFRPSSRSTPGSAATTSSTSATSTAPTSSSAAPATTASFSAPAARTSFSATTARSTTPTMRRRRLTC